jgi:RNA polymerase sigma factor for flagellar operon FliA
MQHMDSMNQEIGASPTAEAQAQAGLFSSDPSDTWNQHDLREFAELCGEDADLLNFETLRLERDERDRNRTGSPARKNIQPLVEKHLGYAHAIAADVLKKCPPHVQREDVRSSAEFGLVQAAQAYDPSRGISFTTFAYYRIKGAISDDLRSAWRATKFEEAANDYMREYSESSPKATTPEEAYEEVKNIASSIASSYLLSMKSLTEEPEEQNTESPLESVLRREEEETVGAALAQLSANNREVLQKYYFEDLSLEEIGREMGFSRSWVCRIHAKGLAQMGESLKKQRGHVTRTPVTQRRRASSAFRPSFAFA